jgi:hypothetical protein
MKKFSTLFIALLCSLGFQAQNYEVTTFTADYMPIENGTIPGGVTPGWDDPFFNVNLGFDLAIGNAVGGTLTQLSLGASFFLTGTEESAVFGYFNDLIDPAGEIPGVEAANITSAISGLPGNQICVIQYENAGFFSQVIEGSDNDRVNFQVWIYESDDAIEFRFGPNTVSNPFLVYEGTAGPQIALVGDVDIDGETFGFAYGLSGDPTNPDILTDIDPEGTFSLNGTPEDGRVYRFAPSTVGVAELSKSEFSVFPTLTTGDVLVQKEDANNLPFHIFDMQGRMVKNGLVNNGERIDLSSLAPGTYLIRLDGYPESVKIVKQ